MSVPLRAAAKILGIHYKTLEIYIKKGYLKPKKGWFSNTSHGYQFEQADMDRAAQIYDQNRRNMFAHAPHLKEFHLKARENRLRRDGQYTNRIGRAPVAA